MKNDRLEKIVDFLFEVGMLAKTPRSGFFFLGSGEQSVA
jgi:putative hydrolase of HD superfamily